MKPLRRQTFVSIINWLALILLVISTLVNLNRAGIFRPVWRTIPLNEFQPELGFAYVAYTDHPELSAQDGPSAAEVWENGKPLAGPANAVHEVIRQSGLGAYSFWQDYVVFSASDNSDPRSNGRAYEFHYPIVVGNDLTRTIYLLSFCFVSGAIFLFFFNPVRRAKVAPFVTNVLPGILTTVIMLVILAFGGEWIMRKLHPFNTIYWPSMFNEKYGWVFTPGETLRFTNYSDFWTEEKVNSLGFLDREPKLSADNTKNCRVAFIGDSFVEAVQVPNEEKLQVVFEKMANTRNSDVNYQTIAFGFSGTGQINQMPFYENFAKPLHPDVVVLVVVSNDLANNSTALESIRNGWHPYYPPRLFYEYEMGTSDVKRIDINPNWMSHLLPILPPVQPNIADFTSLLAEKSYLYTWMNANFFNNSQEFSSFLTGNRAPNEVYGFRLEEVKKIPQYKDGFGDWNPLTTYLDEMFLRSDLPPVFNDAIKLTGYAFEQYKLLSERDDFNLLILTTYNVTTIGGDGKMFNIIKNLADEQSIPVVDQFSYISKSGISEQEIRWKLDQHWNQLGHQTAAEALWEYFEENPSVCQ